MSLSSTTLLVLQKVGAAAFAADAKLKAEVKDYSQRVHEAMVANPDGQKNDALFANWKIVSRLSQAISSIEGELKKLFDIAAALGAEAPAPVAKPAKTAKPAAAPKRAVKKVVKAATKSEPVAAVEVVSAKAKPVKAVKSKAAPKSAPKAVVKAVPKVASKVKALAKPKAKAKAKTTVKKVSAKTAGPVTLGANPTKVLRHLETLLNANDFTVISQTAVSKETGIPLGSMTAATKKLMETGHLVGGPSGSFKLAHAPVAL
jgi:hypothetical protein